jgi:hypothetical protein
MRPSSAEFYCFTDTLQISSLSKLNSVIFKDKASVSVGRKFFSLFPGLGYAAGYKVSNWIVARRQIVYWC